MTKVTRHPEQSLLADPRRVLPRLFVPAPDLPERTRTEAVIDTLLQIDPAEAEQVAVELMDDFAGRHHDLEGTLRSNAHVVVSQAGHPHEVDGALELLVGAVFTAERSVEGAALCNPSVVVHPDQEGLEPGRLRVAVSLRAIGEGHVSAIELCTAVVGPGTTWSFQPRGTPLVPPRVRGAGVTREHLRAMLRDEDRLDVLAHAVLEALPSQVAAHDLETVLEDMPVDLLIHPGAGDTAQLLRRLVASSHVMTFPDDVTLCQQVLLPADPQESQGMEDARFVRFQDDEGTSGYRATYTAYDGRHIAPRLLVSDDLRTFRSTRLTGPGARNKGMALFPRPVRGRLFALCRVDGMTTSLTSSPDGVTWGEPVHLEGPRSVWQLLQVGNCGSPLETEHGWLVLTHGVGPMRRYAIGALLLDLEEPSRVLARLEKPLLCPEDGEQEGYVPNVVYSCGGLVHEGTLWLPYGIGDARIGVASVELDELLGSMTPG
jgi:predicted GH43/DUF377 family glycosyl hydrolase